MERRPISETIRQWLTDEMECWRSAGILANDQAFRILDLYETSTEAAVRRRSLAMFALSGIAALMIGLAALLTVGYNWQAMSAVQKLTVIFGALVGLHGAGFVLRHNGRRLTSEIAFFLACILYGTAIWLIAQIFHIQSHYPDGIWFWALGVLPFALCLNTLLMHALYAGLLAIWVGTEILGFTGIHRLFFHGWSLPGAAWTLPLMVLPGVIWAYKKKSVLAIGLYAPLLAWWAILQPVAWQWEVNPVYFVGLAGALMLLIAEMHRENSPMAKPYRLYGILITGGVLVPLSYGDFIFRLLHHGAAGDNYIAGLVVGLIGAVAALVAVLLQQREASVSPVELLRRQWLPLLLIVLLASICFWSGLFTQYDPQHPWHGYYGDSSYLTAAWSPQVLVPVAAFNGMMIVLALWLMRLGLREDNTGPFAAGVLYFLLWAVLRYEDLFAGVGGMLGAAVMFLLCGVGLLAVARFWFHRKESLPSPFGRGAGGEGSEKDRRVENITLPPDALTLTLSQRERGLRRGFLSGGVVLQLVVLVGMIVFKAAPLWTGETVLLRIVPVDPRDMFRGDYVALAYDFSRIPPEGIPELGKPPYSRRHEAQGTTVYISLVPEEDGKHWKMSHIGTKQPTEGKFLRGTIADWDQIQCGIESYFVQEGGGREYEDAARTRRLSAEVAIAPDGQAVLKKLYIESPLPSTGPTYDVAGKFRWPSSTTYRVRRLPDPKMQIDGRLDEPEWSRANVERHFLFPWKNTDAPPTEFLAFCDDQYLYFAFRAEDADVVALDKLRDKEDVVFEDRVELFFSRDAQMNNYFCLEIDPRGRVFDYQMAYYRQMAKWSCKGLETAATTFDKGYVVEGRIPRTTLIEMGFPQLTPDTKILCGIYRAEFSHDRSDKPVVQKETIHNQGRKPPNGPLPIEEWISWIDPKTPEADFHVPSSLGWLEVVE